MEQEKKKALLNGAKKVTLNYVLPIALAVAAGGLTGWLVSRNANAVSTDKFTVTWKNYDGTILEVDNDVEKGTTPTFDGKIPSKPGTVKVSYSFNGWSPVISPVTMNTTYTAQFAATPELPKYVIVFQNDDGNILEQKTVKLGDVPSYTGETPIKPESTKEKYYDYEFSGWDKEISVALKDAVYTAQYGAVHQKYKVVYYNDDETTILDEQEINKGEEPEYKGVEPTKPSEGGFQYRFKGWRKSGSQEEGKVTLIATYDSAQEGLVISNEGVLTGYNGTAENVVIPNEFGGKKITKIGANAFTPLEEETPTIKNIKISDNITTIEEGAFSHLTSLEEIEFQNNDEFKTISSFMFEGCTSLKRIIIPDSITNIESNAFTGCNSMTTMSIGKGVENIDNSIFVGCPALETINISEYNKNYTTENGGGTSGKLIIDISNPEKHVLKQCLPNVTEIPKLPEDVKVIGKKAFYGCSNLTGEVNLNNVVEIGENAFEGCGMTQFDSGLVETLPAGVLRGCTNLKELTIGENLKELDTTAFEGCSNLENIRITSHGNDYFSTDSGLLYDKNKTKLIKCPQALTSVTILTASSLKTIGNHAFQDCSVNDLAIPNNVETIEKYAFQGCKKLEEIYLGDGVTKIEEYVISGCEKLTKVTLGKSLFYSFATISELALQGCNTLAYIDVNPENQALMSLNGVLCSKGAAGNPSAILRVPYKCDVFGEDGSYEIPATVTIINTYAFKDVKALKKLIIHDDVLVIGDMAFSGTSLTTMKLNGTGANFIDEQASISSSAFSDSGLETIELTQLSSSTGSVMNAISNNLLGGQKINIKVLSNVTSLPYNVFNNCLAFKSIEFEGELNEIGDYAFNRCTQLTEINLPVTLTKIGNNTFKDCFSLEKITNLPNLVSIGDYAFYHCESLSNTDFLKATTLKSIGAQSFRNCSSITSMVFTNVETIGDYAIVDNAKLETLVFGDNLKSIGKYGIANNPSIKSVVLPKSLYSETEEGGQTVCKLGIGACAFQTCTELSNVTFEGTVQEWTNAYSPSSNIFNLCKKLSVIHCSDGDYQL